MAYSTVPNGEVVEREGPATGGHRRTLERLFGVQELAPAVGLALLVAVFSIWTGDFWTPNSLTATTIMGASVGIVAIGVTMLMISGEFDLSVGQIFAFTPIVWGLLIINAGMNEWPALLIAMCVTGLVGVVNGWVTTQFRIPSFIATLGMYFVLNGLNNLLISGNQIVAFHYYPSMILLGLSSATHRSTRRWPGWLLSASSNGSF